jgi:hypothetical protein
MAGENFQIFSIKKNYSKKKIPLFFVTMSPQCKNSPLKNTIVSNMGHNRLAITP